MTEFFRVCVKPAVDKSKAALDDVGAQSLLGMLTGSDMARGKCVGDETLNGVPVKHYVINGDAFLIRCPSIGSPGVSSRCRRAVDPQEDHDE